MLKNKLEVSMYRYNPEVDKFPYMKTYSISKPSKDIMVLDLLNLLKKTNPFRIEDLVERGLWFRWHEY